MDTQRILRQLYVKPRRPRLAWLGSVHAGVLQWIRMRSYRIAAASILFAVWIVGHIYYYNQLIRLECDLHEARAQVAAQEQRRYHVRHALTAVVREYSHYEGTLLKSITELRTATPPALPVLPPNGPMADGPDVKDLLAQLKIVAEQYPELKLSQNLQQFASAAVDVEIEIAARIMAYNDAVNRYTSVLDTFPANVFGRMSGFRQYPFYEVDPKKLPYQEVTF